MMSAGEGRAREIDAEAIAKVLDGRATPDERARR
jgi:hypothetical protein